MDYRQMIMSGTGVNDTVTQSTTSSNETKVFSIIDNQVIDDYSVNGKFSVKLAWVFYLQANDGEKTELFQSLLTAKGEPSKQLFYGWGYNAEEDIFYTPSRLKALTIELKRQNNEQYEEDKKRLGGLNREFFIGKKVELYSSRIGWQLWAEKQSYIWNRIHGEERVRYDELDGFCEAMGINKTEVNITSTTEEVDGTLGGIFSVNPQMINENHKNVTSLINSTDLPF